jgi:hypothetical protein
MAFVWQGWLTLLTGAIAIPAFVRLATTLLERIDTALS